MKKILIISLFLFGGISMSQELNDPIWSQPVKGLQARIMLKYNRTVNDTPIITAYLELCNVSEVVTQLKINWDNGRNIYFNVVDHKGVKLPPSTFPYNGKSPNLEEIILPYESTLKFKISKWGAHIPKNEKVLIDLGHPYVWIIKRDDEKDYF